MTRAFSFRLLGVALLTLAALAITFPLLSTARNAPPPQAGQGWCSEGLTVRDGRVVGANYLGRQDGFADAAGTTGGLGQRLLLVTSTADDARSAHAGTLRHAVETARAAGGGYILFDLPRDAQPITLRTPLRLGSNVTFDGGCSTPRIIDRSAGSAIYLDGVRNVVIVGITLTQTGFADQDEGGDCITVRDGADRVWVAYSAFSACRDGMIDVTAKHGDRRGRVTISDNLFTDHDKVMLVTAAAPDGASCFANGVGNAQLQVSLLRNRFVRVAQRIPRVAGNSFVHSYGNDIAFAPRRRNSGEMSGSYGGLARDGGRLLSQANRYRSMTNDKVLRGLVADGPSQKGRGICAGQGAALSVDDKFGPRLERREGNRNRVSAQSYNLSNRATAWQADRPVGPALR
ncbi:hypothetical protein GRF63_01950 [Erythrobacter sp. GH3-10]|uniref:Pectate lyase domain-containing protein n=1 Tax=Aurantiacibacter rhizosphaerae TaxID=2691582 RepID=A0A844X8J5_9SPHN|nr:hypothetical protein [Aurantiacibacter rhizosphaerae]